MIKPYYIYFNCYSFSFNDQFRLAFSFSFYSFCFSILNCMYSFQKLCCLIFSSIYSRYNFNLYIQLSISIRSSMSFVDFILLWRPKFSISVTALSPQSYQIIFWEAQSYSCRLFIYFIFYKFILYSVYRLFWHVFVVDCSSSNSFLFFQKVSLIDSLRTAKSQPTLFSRLVLLCMVCIGITIVITSNSISFQSLPAWFYLLLPAVEEAMD